MKYMFHVRSARALAPLEPSVGPLPCMPLAPTLAHTLPPPGPHLAPHRMPSFRLSAARVGVQPAAELRHFQRHSNAGDVLRALPPVTCPQSAVDPALLAPRSPAASRLPGRTSPRTACPPFDSRQHASAFNQPLSFDTSSVTNMYRMFVVRCGPNLHLKPPPHSLEHSPHRVTASSPACAHQPSRSIALFGALPRCRFAPHTKLPSTRQNAWSFNQPLSFDTSSVTDMELMFQVRSARALASSLHVLRELRA